MQNDPRDTQKTSSDYECSDVIPRPDVLQLSALDGLTNRRVWRIRQSSANHSPLDEEGATLVEKKGTWLVPALSVMQMHATIGRESGLDPVALEKSRLILKYQSDAFQRAIRHHLRIAFGLDDDLDFLLNEFAAVVKGGLTPTEALQTATTHAAELLGLSSEIGSLEQGKAADIIAVSGDPTKNIHAMQTVVFVMKTGKILRDTRTIEK